MKHLYRIIVSALILVAAGSCGLYTEYQRPATEFADSLYRRFPATGDTTSIAVMSWRELFTDPILQDWIELGLKNNTDLGTAKFKVIEAEASLMEARMALLPGVSFSADGGMRTAGADVKGYFEMAPAVSWEADIFGRLSNSKKATLAALQQSIAYRQAVETRLIATIADTYYTLLMLDEQLNISRRTLNTWEENIRTMEALKRAGKTNEAAVLQAKSNRLSVEASVLTLEKQIFETENSFSALIGIVPMYIRRGSLPEQTFPEEISEGLPAQLLSQRPDVKEAEMALAQAFYVTNMARSAFYPSLTLSGMLGWTTTSGVKIDPTSIISNLAGSLLQPIFSKWTNKARLKKAQAQQEAALYRFRQSLLDAGVEVNNALMTWQTARKRLEIDKKQILNLRAAVWNTRLLMKHSSTNYLEVLTAQQNLLQAELTEITDRFNEIQAVIYLYHALGGGYQENYLENN